MTHNDFNMEVNILAPLLKFKKKIENILNDKQKKEKKNNSNKPRNDDDVE